MTPKNSTPVQLDMINESAPLKASDRTFKKPAKPPTEDCRELLFELEAAGELEVQRVPEPFVEVDTKYGRKKKIPLSARGTTNRAASAVIFPVTRPPSSG